MRWKLVLIYTYETAHSSDNWTIDKKPQTAWQMVRGLPDWTGVNIWHHLCFRTLSVFGSISCIRISFKFVEQVEGKKCSSSFRSLAGRWLSTYKVGKKIISFRPSKKKHMFLVRISIKKRAGGRFFCYLLFPIACFFTHYYLPPGIRWSS